MHYKGGAIKTISRNWRNEEMYLLSFTKRGKEITQTQLQIVVVTQTDS